VPLVATARATTAQFIGVSLTELQTPLTHRFIGQRNATLGHEFFDVAKTEREAEIQPDAVTDDFGRKAVSFVLGSRCVRLQIALLPYASVSCISWLTNLTTPSDVWESLFYKAKPDSTRLTIYLFHKFSTLSRLIDFLIYNQGITLLSFHLANKVERNANRGRTLLGRHRRQ